MPQIPPLPSARSVSLRHALAGAPLWPASLRPLVGLSLVSAALLHAPSAISAQVVQGLVLEEGREAVVPRAQIQLLGTDGAVLHTTRTNASGVFLISAEEPGRYRLRAEQLGFEPVTTEPLLLATDSVTHVSLVMGRDAVPVEAMEVVARREDQLSRATYQGMYQRWGQSPSVGTNRVILPHEREFRGAWTVKDVLSYAGVQTEPRAFGASVERGGARCMVVVFWEGRQIRNAEWAADLLETPVTTVEGIEVYTDPVSSAPLELRPVMDALDEVVCATVAIWPIQEAPAG